MTGHLGDISPGLWLVLCIVGLVAGCILTALSLGRAAARPVPSPPAQSRHEGHVAEVLATDETPIWHATVAHIAARAAADIDAEWAAICEATQDGAA